MALDGAEGADILLVKPALPGLDLIAAARARFDLPIAAYQVSGEYAMLAAAAERGWLDGPRATTEAVTAIVRTGSASRTVVSSVPPPRPPSLAASAASATRRSVSSPASTCCSGAWRHRSKRSRAQPP